MARPSWKNDRYRLPTTGGPFCDARPGLGVKPDSWATDKTLIAHELQDCMFNITQAQLRLPKLVLAALVAPWTGAAHADSLEQLLDLNFEELVNYEVVTPTRSSIRLSEAPGAVSVITYEEIQRSSARTIPELLRRVPGVNVRWNPMVQTIDVRAFGANPFTSKVLLLIDGTPYNSWNKGGFPQHPGFDFFNIDNIKHIEVVRGPGSALYGENAYNGIINIVTLSGEEISATGTSLMVGERNARAVSIHHGSRIGEESSLFASFRASEGQLPTTLWSDNDSVAKGYDLFVKAKRGGASVSYYRRQDDFDGYRYSFENPAFPPDTVFRSAEEIKQEINILALSWEAHSKDDNWHVEANASFANRDGSHCAACHAPAEEASFTEEEDHGFQAFTNVDLSYHGLKYHKLLFGAEFRRHDSGDHRHELAEGAAGHSDESVTRYNKAALYLQDQVTLLENRLDIVAGLRYEGATSPDLFDSQLFPRLAAVFKASDRLTFRGGWSRAARYPSFSELYQDTWFLAAESAVATIPLAVFEPNAGLQPEQIEAYDLGFGLNLSESMEVRVDFFQNRVSHPIIIAYPRFRFENHPNDAMVRGLEVDFRAKPSRNLTAYANWSYQNNSQRGSSTDSSGNPIEFTYSPRHKINLGGSFETGDQVTTNVDIYWKGNYVGPAFWYPLAFGDPRVKSLGDYVYVNTTVSYRPMISGRQPLTITLYGKNLLDERPFETLTGFGGTVEGREFMLSVEYSWSR